MSVAVSVTIVKAFLKMGAGGQIIERVVETVERHRLIEPGDNVLIAFSGGPDSVALADILNQLKRKLDIALAAVYINHLLRPRAAQKETDFCRDFCDRLEIPFHYAEADIPRLAEKGKMGVEEAARKHRYEILEALADRERFDRIAVGHQRDDRAETVLFNLLRGAGRQGMAGMAPKRGKIIRPLYDISRQEVLDYLKARGLKYMTDVSNRSRRFTRNRIRHRVIPVLRREVTEAAVENIVRFSKIMADEEAFLEQATARIDRKVRSVTPGGKIALDLDRILKYDICLGRRIIYRALDAAGLFDIEYAEVERVIDLTGRLTASRLSLHGGLTAETAGGKLYLYRPGSKIERRELTIPGRYRLAYPRRRIVVEYVDKPRVEEMKSSPPEVAYIDAESISGTLFVTGVRQGARLRPYGRPGSKKLGDFLTDCKYPRPLRDELPVLYDDQGVVWVAGLEIDQRVGVSAKTRKTVRLEIQRC